MKILVKDLSIIFTLMFFALSTVSSQTGKRVALIIGNSNYKNAPLRTPINDAELMEFTLKKLDFETITITDASQVLMKKAIIEFGNQSKGANVSLFYYSGHAIQVNGANYLIPLNAKIEKEWDVEFEAVNLSGILAKMEYAKNDFNIIILDAKTNISFKQSQSSLNVKGLASINIPSNTCIAYAASPNMTATENYGYYSTYTQVLSSEMLKVETIERAFINTREKVYTKSEGRQAPWESTSLSGSFYLRKVVSLSLGTKIPKFPWPPPKASATQLVPLKAFVNCKTFFDVDEVIDLALVKNGYYDKSYYVIMPNDSILGFAIATKLEQINKDASSKKGTNRWKTKVEMNDFTFTEYLNSLFFTQTGYFRVIVFVITDIPIVQSKKSLGRKDAVLLVSDGSHILPPSLRNRLFTNNHSITALIYEYKLQENSDKATLIKPSEHTGREHLVKSNLWNTLVK